MIIRFLFALMMLRLAFAAAPYRDLFATAESTAAGAQTCTACPVCEKCPTIASLFLQSSIWIIFSYFLTSCEVLLRSFTLGFGLRMLVFVLMEYPKQQQQSQQEAEGHDGGGGGGRGGNINILKDMYVRRNIQVAILTGVAMASAVFGSSLFIPTNFRVKWFNYNDY
jgi:hypothetical protein